MSDEKQIGAQDPRNFDTWAYDPSFQVEDFLKYVAGHKKFNLNRIQIWRRAIQLYWQTKLARAALAQELGIEFEAVKKLLQLIRRTVKDYLVGCADECLRCGQPPVAEAEVERDGRNFKAANAPRVQTIGPEHIQQAYIEGDHDAVERVESWGSLSFETRLRMFSTEIADTLIELLRRSDELGVLKNGSRPIADELLAEVGRLKNSVAKDDPHGCINIAYDKRTHYRNRGRPNKPATSEPKPPPPPIEFISGFIHHKRYGCGRVEFVTDVCIAVAFPVVGRVNLSVKEFRKKTDEGNRYDVATAASKFQWPLKRSNSPTREAA